MAGTIHLLADVVDAASAAVVGTVKGSATVAASTADQVTDKVVPFVPRVLDVKLPGVVHSSVDLVDSSAKTAKSIVDFGVCAVDNAGRALGSGVAGAVLPQRETTPDSGGGGGQEDAEPEGFVPETVAAMKRLVGSSVGTVTSSLDAVDFATSTVIKSARRNSTAVIAKTLGDETAQLVGRAVDIAQTSLDTVKTAKTLGGTQSLLKMGEKAVIKGALDKAKSSTKQNKKQKHE